MLGRLGRSSGLIYRYLEIELVFLACKKPVVYLDREVNRFVIDKRHPHKGIFIECDLVTFRLKGLAEVFFFKFLIRFVLGFDFFKRQGEDIVSDVLAAVESNHGISAFDRVFDFLGSLYMVTIGSEAAGEVLTEHREADTVEDIVKGASCEIEFSY